MDYLGDRLDIRDLAIARRSARKEPWQIVNVRPLTRDDLALLQSHLPTPCDPKAPLARISAPHHTLARFVAEGKSVVEISAITGYTTNRIRTLQEDPAFRELVAHYEEQVVFAEADIQGQIQHVALMAKQLLMERLESEPDAFTHKDLMALMTAGLDRVGHGPSSKVNMTVNNTAEIIAKLHEATQQNQRSRVLSREEIDAECKEVPSHEPAEACARAQES